MASKTYAIAILVAAILDSTSYILTLKENMKPNNTQTGAKIIKLDKNIRESGII
jgi:hypothetical protein